MGVRLTPYKVLQCYTADPLVQNCDPGCLQKVLQSGNTRCYKLKSESCEGCRQVTNGVLRCKFPYILVDVRGQAASFSRELFHGLNLSHSGNAVVVKVRIR